MDIESILDRAVVVVLVALTLFYWHRGRRMRAVIEAPETVAERAARLQVPAGLEKLSASALVAAVREDLRNADVYLESAQGVLDTARNLSVLDILGFNQDVGEGGPKEDSIHHLFGELMHADRFLLDARHKLRALGERTDLEVPAFGGDIDTFTLDWLVDHPLTDFATHRKLKALEPELVKLRAAVAALRQRAEARRAG